MAGRPPLLAADDSALFSAKKMRKPPSTAHLHERGNEDVVLNCSSREWRKVQCATFSKAVSAELVASRPECRHDHVQTIIEAVGSIHKINPRQNTLVNALVRCGLFHEKGR